MNNVSGENKHKQHEDHEFIITEMRKHYASKTLRYVSVLAFVATLAISFQSYLPCIFLLLLYF